MGDEIPLYDVLIVGAGISGLRAAYELKKRADWLKLLVLEAKDRVGGRTETVVMRTANSTDQFDIGGQWVGTTQLHLLELMEELRLSQYPQYADGTKVAQLGGDHLRHYTDTVPNTLRAAVQFSPLEILAFARFLQKVQTLTEQLDAENPFATPGAADWDAISVKEFARTAAGDCPMVMDTVDTVCQTVFGASSDRFSMLYFLIYSRNCGSMMDIVEARGKGAQAFRIVDGAQQISRRLAESIGSELVRFKHPVVRILRSDQGVDVFCMDSADGAGGDALRRFRAKRLILAMPPQQIGRLLFEPPLPEAHAQLFGSFPSGNLFKFVVTYATPFWRQKGLSGEVVACGKPKNGELPRPVLVTYDGTTSCDSPAILGFLDTAWCGSKEKKRRQAVLEDLAKFFGEEAFDYIDYVDKSWSEEPYNGGCPVGVLPTGAGRYYSEAIRKPVGVIHWAGTESARLWMGYMSGAVEAGQRAAREVLAHLSPESLTAEELTAATTVKETTKKWACPKRKTCLSWTSVTVGVVVVAALGYALAKRYRLESPVKIKFIRG